MLSMGNSLWWINRELYFPLQILSNIANNGWVLDHDYSHPASTLSTLMATYYP